MLITVLLFAFLFCCLAFRHLYIAKFKLPPVLWGLPIFGNIHWFVAANPGKILLNIGKKRGPVLFTTIGSFNTVILNGHKAVKEGCKFMPLNKRPDSVYKTLADNHGYLFSDDNVEYRKFIFRYFKHFGMNTLHKEKMIQEEVNNVFVLIDQCCGKPQEVRNLFSVATLNVIFYLILSKRYDVGDPDLIPVIKAVNYLSEMPNILNRAAILMPWITKVIPSISGHYYMMGMVLDLFLELENLFEEHCKTRVPNQPRDLSDAYVDKYGRTTFISHMSGSPQNLWPIVVTELFVGAIETTSGLLEWIIAYLAHNQEVQKKVQEEIALVTDNNGYPSLLDRQNMPYMQAVIEEALRIRPLLGFGFHSSQEETQFEGYTIPKQTMVIANFYGCNHDPDIFDEPDQFRPERFLDGAGNFRKSDYTFSFGSGRRSCPGEAWARDQVFLVAARLFYEYDVMPVGKFPGFIFGIVSRVDHFDVIFNRRYSKSTRVSA